ncbi:MAG: DUF4845 domain-containing protein [Deltaproteobacteria bacterium]|nr:DUF4845 domain-containing protein [Deltaproteobacteria bacterium]
MKPLMYRRGLSNIDGKYFFTAKTNFYIVLGFIVLFLVTKYAPPYIDSFEVKKAIEETIKTSGKSDSQSKILEKLVRKLRGAGLRDFEPADFVLDRSHNRARITADYDVYVKLGFGYGHYLHMHVKGAGFLR